MKTIENINGHLILLCKGHYKTNDLLTALKQIWAIRCGYDYDEKDNLSYRYIAKNLYNILKDINSERIEYIIDRIHDEVDGKWKDDNKLAIERIIEIYCSELAHLKVKEKVNTKYRCIIKLPKPNKRVFNRILRGNGKYSDYKLISK